MMKKTFISLAPALLLLLPVGVSSQTEDAGFNHPGVFHSLEDLNRLRDKVAANEEPWLSGFLALQADSRSSASYVMQGPRASVGRNPNQDNARFENDGAAVFQNAVMWYITGAQAHANKAIQILDAWSDPANPNRLQNFTGADRRLVASIIGQKWLGGAEIIRRTGAGWSAAGIENFSNMVRNIIYPVTRQYGGGNWGTGCVATNLAIGVFLDDQAIFDEAVNVFKYGAQTQCDNGVSTYIEANGQNSETDRDQEHSQLGIGHLAAAAEIAWQQGVDLYAYLGNRLLTGFEYTANYNLGNDVPFTPSVQCDGLPNSSISAVGRGSIRPLYEMVWNHYQNRMGVSANFVGQAADQLRPEGYHLDHPGFGTIYFSRETRAAGLPTTPTGLASMAGNGQVGLTWESASGATSYNVKRATSRIGPYTTIATGVETNNYTDTTVNNGTLNYYAVSAVNGTGETINSGLATALPSNVAPAAPVWLTATAMNSSRIDVAWAASPGATNYTVKRSTTSGGPYTTVATVTGESFLNYKDTSLPAGTTHYYVVSAVNHIGEGAASSEASETTLADPPVPWTLADAGYLTTPAQAIHSGGAFTLKAAGLDIGGNRDSFGFLYRNMTGDGTITARITGLTNYSQLNKVCLMMRATLANNSKFVCTFLSGTSVFVGFRSATGSFVSGTPVSVPGVNPPQWLRLTRMGDTFTGYTSADGTDWTQLSSVNVTMNSDILVGLAMTSRNNAVLDTATFDNVSVGAPIPVITSATTAAASVGIQFNYTITATNSPASFGAIGLPSGLTLNAATGVISGAPLASGVFPVTLEAINSEGGKGTATLILSVVSGLPVITSPTTATGRIGIAFSYTITATNSQGMFNASGLPPGLSVNNSTGAITGTPTEAGIYNVAISASNAFGTDTRNLTLTIDAPIVTNGAWNNTSPLQPTLTFTNGSADIAFTGTAPAVGDVLRVNASVGNFLNTNAYFVRSVSDNTLQLAAAPGGSAQVASASGSSLAPVFMNWNNSSNWVGNAIASGVNATATFSALPAGTRIALGGDFTIGHIDFTGGGSSDLDLFGYDYVATAGGSITFATGTSTTPSFTVARNATFPGNIASARNITVLGNQGLEIITASDATTGTTVSFRPQSGINWSGFSGYLQLRQGRIDAQANNVLPSSSNLVVGNARTSAGRFAVLSIGSGRNQTIGALVGASIGRVTSGSSSSAVAGTPVTLTVGANDGSGEFAGVIGADAAGSSANTRTISLVKNGAGAQILSGANTYTGATTVNDGALLVNGSIVSVVNVNAGALGGVGHSAAAVTVGNGQGADAMLAPGSGLVGTFTTDGALTLNSDATLAIEINTSTGAADRVSANGVTISDAHLTLTAAGSAMPLPFGATFVIVNNTGDSAVTGTFDGLPEGSTVTDGLNSYTLSYTSGTGNDITIRAQDTTPPVITASAAAGGLPYTSGAWTNRNVVVSFMCNDGGSGVASVSLPVTLSGEGANQAASGVCADAAGNSASVSFTGINIDKTAPEAYLQFGPEMRDALLFGRDALSGAAPGAIAASQVAPVPWTADDDIFGISAKLPGEGPGNTEQRTYSVTDAAGNILTLVAKVRRSNRQIKARILNLKYNEQTMTSPSRNTTWFAWEVNSSNSIKQLTQTMARAQSDGKLESTSAIFDSRLNRTLIFRLLPPPPPPPQTRPGLVLLRIATNMGDHMVEY